MIKKKELIKFTVIKIFIFITVVIVFSFHCGCKKEVDVIAEQLVVMEYNRTEKKELVSFIQLNISYGLKDYYYKLDQDKIFFIDNVRYFDRNLRYINDQSIFICPTGNKDDSRFNLVVGDLDTLYILGDIQINKKNYLTDEDIIFPHEGYWGTHIPLDNEVILADNYYLLFLYKESDIYFMKSATDKIVIFDSASYNIYYSKYNKWLSDNQELISKFAYKPKSENIQFIKNSNRTKFNNNQEILANNAYKQYSKMKSQFIDNSNKTKTNFNRDRHSHHKLFNPLPNLNYVALSSLPNYRLSMNFNQYNYLKDKFYIKKLKEKYDKVLLAEKSENKEALKKYGWKISILDLDKIGESADVVKKKEKFIENYPIYQVSSSSNLMPIPHKCWSPDGHNILFVGSQDNPWSANVYIWDIDSDKVTGIFDSDYNSGNYNPDLEWSKHGILVTRKDGLFLRKEDQKIKRINIPEKISEYRNGKFSESGRKIMFFGKTERSIYLFIIDCEGNILTKRRLGEGNLEDFQGAWIYDKLSIIKNEADFYTIPDNPTNDRYFRLKYSFGYFKDEEK